MIIDSDDSSDDIIEVSSEATDEDTSVNKDCSDSQDFSCTQLDNPINPVRPNDFSSYVGQRLSDQERLNAITKHFKPNEGTYFPSHTEYGKKRSFVYSWLNSFKWLVYSPSKDGVYCMACVLFGDTTVDKNCSKLKRLVKVLITFWTTASSKLKKHEEKA